MRILIAAFTACLGLFFLLAAVIAFIREPSVGAILGVALMGVVGFTTIRVAGYMLTTPKD